MPFISSFYGPGDPAQPAAAVFYHNNSACLSGNRVPGTDRQASTGGHRLCDECDRLNKNGR